MQQKELKAGWLKNHLKLEWGKMSYMEWPVQKSRLAVSGKQEIPGELGAGWLGGSLKAGWMEEMHFKS